jgi:hypothetical protein
VSVTTFALPLEQRIDAPPADRAMRWAWVALFCVCAASALLGRLVYLADPFGGDGAMFAYMGKLVAEGGRMGVDLIDNKFPTVGFLTSLFWRTFGTHWAGYVIAQTSLCLLAALALSRAAGQTFGAHARLATLLPAVVLMNLNAAVMGGFQLESIQSAFATLAAACALYAMKDADWRDAFAAGLAAGCATLVKPTGGAVLGALVMLQICARAPGSIKTSAAAVAGAIIPLIAAAIYLHVSDQLRLIPGIARQIGEYSANTSFDAWDLYRPLSLVFLFGMALLIRGWVFRRSAPACNASLALRLFPIVWLVLELVGVLMQRRMYAYHFLPLAAPAALTFGSLPRRTTLGQLLGVLAIPLFFNAWGSLDTWRLGDGGSTKAQLAAWLDARCLPGERVWRDQTVDLLLGTDLRSASRIQLTFIFMNSDTSPQRFAGILLDDLNTSRPPYVVLPADVEGDIRLHTTGILELARIPLRRDNFARAWRDIHRWVMDRYEPVTTIGRETIWQRRRDAMVQAN